MLSNVLHARELGILKALSVHLEDDRDAAEAEAHDLHQATLAAIERGLTQPNVDRLERRVAEQSRTLRLVRNLVSEWERGKDACPSSASGCAVELRVALGELGTRTSDGVPSGRDELETSKLWAKP
jgi:hypothetical protein